MKWIKNEYLTLKNLAIFFLALLFSQLVLASVYYVERIAFLDASFVLSKIINESKPTIMVGRYGSILTQAWPWVGLKLGLSMDILMWLYSISFPTLYLISGLILYKTKQFQWVVILGFYFILFNTESYFWTNNEIHQAIALFCLGIGLFNYIQDGDRPYKNIKLTIISLLLGLAIHTHPLMLIVVSYYIAFYVLRYKNRLFNIHTTILLGSIFLFGLLKYLSSKSNWYDGNKFDTLKNIDIASWLAILKDEEFKRFFLELPITYPAALCCVICLFYLLFSKRLRLYGLMSILFLVIHVSLVALVVDIYNRFYIESQYMLLSIVMTLPIVANFDNFSLSQKKLFFLYSIAAVFWWWVQFGYVSQIFVNRVQWIEQKVSIMKKNSQNKSIIRTLKESDKELLRFTWGLPTESLLISSRKGESFTLIFEEHIQPSNLTMVYYDCFETKPSEYLNKKYFDIPTDARYGYIDSFEEKISESNGN